MEVHAGTLLADHEHPPLQHPRPVVDRFAVRAPCAQKGSGEGSGGGGRRCWAWAGVAPSAAAMHLGIH